MTVLAFDIETLGLLHSEHDDDGDAPEITCVCLYDGCTVTALRLWKVAERSARIARLIAMLDDAPILAGYNAIHFDIECMRRAFALDDVRVQAWRRKCLDLHVVLRLLCRATYRLQRLLDLNPLLGSKSAGGGDAIAMAKDDRWDELLAYCSLDARLTHALVCDQDWIHLGGGLECCLDRGRSPPAFRYVWFE